MGAASRRPLRSCRRPYGLSGSVERARLGRRRRTPRRRRAATRGRPPGRPRGRRPGWTRTPRGWPGARLGHHQRLLVHAPGDQHEPLDGAGDDAVVGSERRRGRQLGVRHRGHQHGRHVGGPPAARRRPPAAWPRPPRRAAGPAGRRAPSPRRPACAAGPGPAAATGTASAPARAARSRPAPRPAATWSPGAGPHLRPATTPNPPARRCVGAAEQRLGGRLRRRTPQPPVAQHRVDAVAGRRERRRHALQGLANAVGGRRQAHGRNAIAAGNFDSDEPSTTPELRPAPSAGSPTPTTAAGRPTPARRPLWLTSDQPLSRARARRRHRQADRAARGPRPRRARHRPGPADARHARQERLPEVRVSQAPAEEIPSGDRSYDVVVSAQAFHWFDLDKALPEIARVLKAARPALAGLEPARRAHPVGAPARRDHRHPGAAARPGRGARAARALFGERRGGGVPVPPDRRPALDQRPGAAPGPTSRRLPPAEREAKMAEVLAFYDEYGRGMDGMQLPYAARCFRTQVLDRPASYTGPTETRPRTPSRPQSPTAPTPTCCSSTSTDTAPTGSVDRTLGNRSLASATRSATSSTTAGCAPMTSATHAGPSGLARSRSAKWPRRAGTARPRVAGVHHLGGPRPGPPRVASGHRPAPGSASSRTARGRGRAAAAGRCEPAATITTGRPGTAPASTQPRRPAPRPAAGAARAGRRAPPARRAAASDAGRSCRTWWPVESSSGTTTVGSADAASTACERGLAQLDVRRHRGQPELPRRRAAVSSARDPLPAAWRVPCATVTSLMTARHRQPVAALDHGLHARGCRARPAAGRPPSRRRARSRRCPTGARPAARGGRRRGRG